MIQRKRNPHPLEIDGETPHSRDETTHEWKSEKRFRERCPDDEADLFTLLSLQTTKKQYKEIFEFMVEFSSKNEDQSFFVCDLANVLWQVQQWKEKLPMVHPFYAVKANPDPVLLKFLSLLGVSFDCATEAEIRLVLDAGGTPKNIVYAHPFKPSSGLEFAKSVGVDLMVVDSECETVKIHSIYPNARLLVRIRPVGANSFFDFSAKYGCTYEETRKTLQKAKELDMNVVGVSFHVGSLTMDSQPFVSSILEVHAILDLFHRMGFNSTVMDIGGGFFGQDPNNGLTNEITQSISANLENFPADLQFIAEPGCCIVRSAFTLITTIVGKKEKGGGGDKNVNGVKKYYYLNDGIYTSFNNHMEKYCIELKPLLAEQEILSRPLFKSKLWGHSLCSTDVIREECLLPEMSVGESLMWENMGAYSLSICSTFCGTPKPTTRYVFVRNDRLNTKWLKNLKEVVDFLAESTVIIHSDKKVLSSCPKVATIGNEKLSHTLP